MYTVHSSQQATCRGNLPEGDRRRLRRRISNRESAKRLRAGQQKSLNEVQVWEHTSYVESCSILIKDKL
ncbi:hypothetical protein ABBQ32_010447 [Trebouxia sp. C0010 RCD-2024]